MCRNRCFKWEVSGINIGNPDELPERHLPLSGKESAFGFGVNSPKTMNSVQKSSEIRNFCTEFLYFAYLAKIESVCIAKSHIFVFFSQKLAF